MVRKERPGTAACVSRVPLFVTGPYDNAENPDQALVLIEEGMPSECSHLHSCLLFRFADVFRFSGGGSMTSRIGTNLFIVLQVSDQKFYRLLL